MNEPRTEEATPRKLAEARRRGQVAVSAVLSAGVASLALGAGLIWSGHALTTACERLLRAALQAAALAPARRSLAQLADPLRELAWALSPLLLAPCAAVVLIGVVQAGPLFAAGALRPDLGRIDPRSRLRGLWSGDRMLEVGYSALAACALCALLAWLLTRGASGVLTLPQNDPLRALSVLATLLADIVLRMSVAVLLFGTIDLAVRKQRARRALRMSRRELSAELRESYGLPEQRARRERLQREAVSVAALQALQDARLLLIDSSGRAIALGFGGPALAVREPRLREQAGWRVRAQAGRSPRVIVKAQGALAVRLRAAAAQSELPVRDHGRLVSVLFRLELGEAVHSEHYAELAELFVEAGAA